MRPSDMNNPEPISPLNRNAVESDKRAPKASILKKGLLLGLLFGIPMSLLSSHGPLHEPSKKRAILIALVGVVAWVVVFTWFAAIAASRTRPTGLNDREHPDSAPGGRD